MSKSKHMEMRADLRNAGKALRRRTRINKHQARRLRNLTEVIDDAMEYADALQAHLESVERVTEARLSALERQVSGQSPARLSVVEDPAPTRVVFSAAEAMAALTRRDAAHE